LLDRTHNNTGGTVTRKICVITRLTTNRDTPETTTERLTASPTPVGPFSQFNPWKLATTAAMMPNIAALRYDSTRSHDWANALNEFKKPPATPCNTYTSARYPVMMPTKATHT